jgi:hypothetical protein
VDPNLLRFCDERNLGSWSGGPAGGVKMEKPYSKSFKLSGALPLVYGINFGVSYQNLDGGTLTPTFRYGASTSKYPGAGTYTMLGKDANGVFGANVTSCPVAYGCVAGAATPVFGGSSGTSIQLYPNSGAQGAATPVGTFIKGERIVQLDIRASKNFRYGRYSIQPTFEAFNLMNIDEVRGRTSSELGNVNYLQPNAMLQGRVLGFGANIKF